VKNKRKRIYKFNDYYFLTQKYKITNTIKETIIRDNGKVIIPG